MQKTVIVPGYQGIVQGIELAAKYTYSPRYPNPVAISVARFNGFMVLSSYILCRSQWEGGAQIAVRLGFGLAEHKKIRKYRN